jgi:hypothetical protein
VCAVAASSRCGRWGAAAWSAYWPGGAPWPPGGPRPARPRCSGGPPSWRAVTKRRPCSHGPGPGSKYTIHRCWTTASGVSRHFDAAVINGASECASRCSSTSEAGPNNNGPKKRGGCASKQQPQPAIAAARCPRSSVSLDSPLASHLSMLARAREATERHPRLPRSWGASPGLLLLTHTRGPVASSCFGQGPRQVLCLHHGLHAARVCCQVFFAGRRRRVAREKTNRVPVNETLVVAALHGVALRFTGRLARLAGGGHGESSRRSHCAGTPPSVPTQAPPGRISSPPLFRRTRVYSS